MDTQYIVARLREPSTWRGILMLCTALGVKISPEFQEAIMQLGLAAVGLVGMLTSDKK